MVEAIGLGSAEELFDSIPQDLRLQRPLNTPAALSEIELLDRFEQMGARNAGARRVSFKGAGAYSHYIPTIVDHILTRSEFFTAYTPYQPEISQGTLQTIFEFQTLVCQLTGMEVANASMYDGSTGLAEAVLMAERVTRRSKVIASSAAHPQYLEVVRTYVQHAGIHLQLAPFDEQTGQSARALAEAIDDSTAALVVQSPNFFGCIEDLRALADAAHAKGALLVVAITEAMSLGLLKSPGACGADIVVAEGQSFGVPLSFGGPYVGLFATREKYARQIPGRLVGVTADLDGRRAFVMTLRAREQDIRREKAASNICTNQALLALAASVYLATVGPHGLRDVAALGAANATALEAALAAAGAPRIHAGAYLNELVVRVPDARGVHARLLGRGVLAGIPTADLLPDEPSLADGLLVCATEVTTAEEIERFAAALRAELEGAGPGSPPAPEPVAGGVR